MATRKAVAPESNRFDVVAFQMDTIDAIEKRQNFQSMPIEDIKAMSTGLLQVDLLLGGGIRPAWYSTVGAEQSAKTTTALTMMSALVKAEVPMVSFNDYEGSSGNSGPYIQSIMDSTGLKLHKDQVFGKKSPDGKWLIRPKVRYRSETSLEAFFDFMHAVLQELPDKRYVNGKWWLIYDDTKANKAKLGEYADTTMTKKHGAGIWVPANDGKLQAVFLVDSYPAMLPTEQDQEEGNNSLALQARAFSKHIPRVKGRMQKKMVAVIGINQLRAVPMARFGPTENEPGGNALKLYSDVRIRQTSRALSAAPFKATPDKQFNEQEPSVEYEGGFDTYRYVHAKTTKNKLSMPGRQCFMRIWVSDGADVARGLDPVLDTILYLQQTGQLTGSKQKGFKMNLSKLGEASRTVPWLIIKKWILCDKEKKVKICKALGYEKPFDLRAFCFKQMQSGEAEVLYVEHKTKTTGSAEEDDNGSED